MAGIVASLGELASAVGEEPEFGWLFVAVSVAAFALMGLLIYFVSQRRNWARIVALLLTIAGIAAIFWLPAEGASLLEWTVEIGLTAAEVLALYWLFTGEGAAWFSKRKGGAF